MPVPRSVEPRPAHRPAPSRRALMRGAAWSVPVVAAAAVAAPAFAVSCPPEWTSALGRGKVLSGGLFSADLDTLASVNGVIASAPTMVTETGVQHSSSGEGDPDEHYNPLSIELLSDINVDIGGVGVALTSILSGLTPANVGLVNQYGLGDSTGISIGASGYVDNNGAVSARPSGGYPEMGRLNLKALLTPLLSGAGATFLANNVADLSLEIGALAGRARTEWTCVTESVSSLERDYLLANLRLTIESALVKNLVSVLNTAVLGISIPLVGGLKVDATVLTNGPLPSGTKQPIQADLAAGTITVDLGALLGGDDFGANYSEWLNGRKANTLLFVDTPIPSSALTNFLSGLITGLEDRLLDAVSVTILSNTGTLRSLLSIPVIGDTLKLLIKTINGLFTNAGPVKTALDAVSNLLSTVFGWLTDVINLRVNAQNLPEGNTSDSASLHAGPNRWQSLPARRYDVAALGVSAVQNATLLDLFLGRGSVGPVEKL